MSGIAGGRELLAETFDDAFRDRFWARGQRRANGCLIWPGSSKGQSGVVGYDGRTYLVRRIAYALTHDVCPARLPVVATCGHDACFEPTHLATRTVSEVLKARERTLTAVQVRKIRRLWSAKSTDGISALFPEISRRMISEVGSNRLYHDPTYQPRAHWAGDLTGRSTRLTNEKVAGARRRHARGESVLSLARDEAVAYSTMHHALHGKSWQHVVNPPPCRLAHYRRN
jgi:hypothetical protein